MRKSEKGEHVQVSVLRIRRVLTFSTGESRVRLLALDERGNVRTCASGRGNRRRRDESHI